MKQLSAAIPALAMALALTACGGGGDTSSKGGNDSTFGTTASSQDTGTSGASDSNDADSIPAGSSESESSSDSSSPDGTYRGQLTATLSGDGVLPVTDSTDLVIKISGSEVTATAEGRSYKGKLSGDTFTVKIPIDEESRGIVCQGTPVLEGRVKDGTASGKVSGKGECFSEAANVPVFVTGEFSTRK